MRSTDSNAERQSIVAAALETITRIRRRLISHPEERLLPKTQVDLGDAFLELSELTNALRHLLEARRLLCLREPSEQAEFRHDNEMKIAKIVEVLVEQPHVGLSARLSMLENVQCPEYYNRCLFKRAMILYSMKDLSACVILLEELSQRYATCDISIICARVHFMLKQEHAAVVHIHTALQRDSEHKELEPYVQLLYARAHAAKTDCAELLYKKMYETCIERARQGLFYCSLDPDLLYYECVNEL